MVVSVFTNFNNVSENLPLPAILDRVRDGRYRAEVESLRRLIAGGDQKEYDRQKRTLPAFTPSAIFEGGRKIDYLKSYTGFIILDLDKLTPDQLAAARQKLPGLPGVFSFFVSPSGNGLKVIVKTSAPQEKHLNAFEQVRTHFEQALKLKVDPSGKDITRLCFFSYDPDLYLNPESMNFPVITPTIQDDIENIISQIEARQIDITQTYDDWLKTCFALIDALGPGARDSFHRVSRFHPKYNSADCDKQFDHCFNSHNSGITAKTFFFLAQSHGITVSSISSKTTPGNNKPKLDTKPAEIPVKPAPTKKPSKSRKPTTNKFQLVRDYLLENFDLRYNIVSTQFEYREKGESSYQALNENDIYIKMQLDGLSFSLNNLVAFLKSNIVPRYNPFIEYFESLPSWDTFTDHITHLASFVRVKEETRARFDNHFKKWLVRAIKCALVDTYFNKQAFILVHDKQNSGKSTYCRFLCPHVLSNYIAENLSVDKDSRILLTTNLLINLDELSTLSKVEINALKSLFSKDKINDRLPYDRKNSIIPRRCSFIGSTNQSEFLTDETGSVRWLCFAIESIDWSYIEKVNIDLVWSQAYHLFKNDFQCDLTPEEIRENEESNRQFHIVSSEFELVNKYFSPAGKEKHDSFMTATDILLYISEATESKVRLNVVNIGRALKMLSFTREKKYPERVYGYYVFNNMYGNP